MSAIQLQSGARWADRIDAVAQQKVGKPDFFVWLYRRADQGGVFVTGSVCPLITKGKNKGKPNFRKRAKETDCQLYLTDEESK